MKLLDFLISRIPTWLWTTLACIAGMLIIREGLEHINDLPRLRTLPRNSDKVMHFVAYALFTTLVFRAVFPTIATRPARVRYGWWIVILAPSILGAIDELLQGYVERGRSSDIMDWIADTLGGLFVAALAAHDRWRKRAIRRRTGATQPRGWGGSLHP